MHWEQRERVRCFDVVYSALELRRYLIVFAPPTIALGQRVRSSKVLSPWVVQQGSTHFTARPTVRLTLFAPIRHGAIPTALLAVHKYLRACVRETPSTASSIRLRAFQTQQD